LFNIINSYNIFDKNINYDRSQAGIIYNTLDAAKVGFNNILFGVGIGNYAAINEMDPVRGLLPRMFADTGLIGMCLVIAFIVSHFLYSFKIRKISYLNRIKILTSFSIYLGFIQMVFFFNGGIYLMYFWILLAYSAHVKNES
jgi:hypothetical protein